jgi:hypothetical protein
MWQHSTAKTSWILMIGPCLKGRVVAGSNFIKSPGMDTFKYTDFRLWSWQRACLIVCMHMCMHTYMGGLERHLGVCVHVCELVHYALAFILMFEF